MVALWFCVTLPEVAENVALFCPAATITLAGTDRLALLLESDTRKPPTGAAALRLTVQSVLPGVATEDAAQPTVVKEAGGGETDTAILPDPPVAGIKEAAAEAAARLVRLIGIVPEALGESWNVAVATNPLLIPARVSP